MAIMFVMLAWMTLSAKCIAFEPFRAGKHATGEPLQLVTGMSLNSSDRDR